MFVVSRSIMAKQVLKLGSLPNNLTDHILVEFYEKNQTRIIPHKNIVQHIKTYLANFSQQRYHHFGRVCFICPSIHKSNLLQIKSTP